MSVAGMNSIIRSSYNPQTREQRTLSPEEVDALLAEANDEGALSVGERMLLIQLSDPYGYYSRDLFSGSAAFTNAGLGRSLIRL